MWLLTLAGLCFFWASQPTWSEEDKGVYREQRLIPNPESKLQIPEMEVTQRIIAGQEKSLKLASAYERQIDKLLKAADGYDVEAYRKADDELGDIYDQQDANLLESMMLADALSLSKNAQEEIKTYLQESADYIKQSKLFSYKSSSIFHLCFGLPVQSDQCARLALSIAEANPKERDKIPDLLACSGAACFWAGDYQRAEEQLVKSIELAPDNEHARYCLADLYVAQEQAAKAIDLLVRSRARAKEDEVRGNIDRRIALAYILGGQEKLAQRHIELAKSELDAQSPKKFAGIARASLGIVSVLAGDYIAAEEQLSEALSLLQLSPIKLGHRLEAAQTALWRSYCRYKLGDKIGAGEDRKYALSFVEEATHLQTLAHLLDPMFGYKPMPTPVGEIKNKWAIVIGVGTFADPSVPRLRYPSKDAKDMEEFLLRHGGFKRDHIKTLLDGDATRAAIIDTVGGKWLASVAHPGDLVFVFVSSHGTPAYENIGALNSIVTYDTRLDHLFTTSIPMQSLVRMMRNRLKKQRTFLVLDTCYAGGLSAPGSEARVYANVDPELLVSSHYQLLVASSDRNQRSWESKRYANSIFTRQLIDTIESRPRYDDFHSIFNQVVSAVSAEVLADYKHNQTPKVAGRWSGRGLIDPPEPRAATPAEDARVSK